MAGYVTKFVGRVYEGGRTAGEALTNGVFAEITASGVKKITATKDQVLRVEEKTTLWGLPAVVLTLVSAGANEVYFVENEWDYDDSAADFDEKAYTLAKDKYVRMKRLLPGEQVIMSIAQALYEALDVDDTVNPANTGTIAATE
jgi:hypothetical protein